MTVVIVSCGGPGDRNLVRFFFDIPEDGAAPANMERAATPWYRKSVTGRIQFVSEHVPFQARDCSACHDDGSARQPRQDELAMCGSCHADLYAPRAAFHGPFVAGACGYCHEPHLSQRSDLLRDSDPSLCLGCHEPIGFRHCAGGRIGVQRGCLPCHEPHSADAAFLLRPAEEWKDLLKESGVAQRD